MNKQLPQINIIRRRNVFINVPPLLLYLFYQNRQLSLLDEVPEKGSPIHTFNFNEVILFNLFGDALMAKSLAKFEIHSKTHLNSLGKNIHNERLHSRQASGLIKSVE